MSNNFVVFVVVLFFVWKGVVIVLLILETFVADLCFFFVQMGWVG